MGWNRTINIQWTIVLRINPTRLKLLIILFVFDYDSHQRNSNFPTKKINRASRLFFALCP